MQQLYLAVILKHKLSNMKKLIMIFVPLSLTFAFLLAQPDKEIKLIIRGDDIGIKSYREGIMRTVEIMVPCPWFPEAVSLLKENPGLDVGVHITITSEWENLKWGPLTCAPGLTDEDGYFYPMIWPNKEFAEDRALKTQDWKIEEIEAEMRAQIEMAMKHIPQVSHLSCHMGCSNWDDRVAEVYNRLAREYKLEINPGDYSVERFPMEDKGETLEERTKNFISALEKLEPGKTYLYVEHPAVSSPEMEAIGHSGYYGVNMDRDLVTKVFTSEEIKKVIKDRGIRLISYADLVK
jgi:predicted glycoside hydrolase/deacetylase ChbG (UPF0249 family)